MVDILINHARCIGVIAAVIAFLVVPAPQAFPDVIKIDENLTSRTIGLDIEYLEDAEGKLTFDDIKGGKLTGSWTASKTENPGFGFTGSVYWVRFTVLNTARREIQFYLDQNFPQADFIRLYVPENGAYRIIETGDSKPFSERPLEHRSFVFPLKLKAGAQGTYYVMLKSVIMNIILRISSPQYFQKTSSNEYYIIMLFYGIILIMLVYNLILFFFIRRIEYLYYTIFVFFLMLFMMGMDGIAFQYLWPNSPWWTTFCMPLLINLMMIFVILFCVELVELNRLKKKNIYLRISYYLSLLTIFLYVLITALYPFLPHYISGMISVASAAISLLYIGATGITMIIKEKSRPALLGMIAASAVILGSVAYSLKNIGILPINFFTEWSMHGGIVIMLVLFSITLADRINIMRKDLAVLNSSLEERVIERTEELHAAMEELEAMNDEMHASNELLISTNSELEEAQRIAKLDMIMAANVQSTILPKEPPILREWDVAFTFRPMAGVSGDFFDFYTDGDTLEGVALFDVSGHGTASGLITMIARSVLFRNFNKGEDMGLGSILKQSNGELINEIRKTDKYLTGILLRLREDTVEYANAAHTELIHREHKTGDVRVIKHEGTDHKGMIMGIDGIDKSYPTLKFQVNKGDMIVLYTDCLDESRNEEGNEYGMERIKKSIKSVKVGTAQQVLDSIMNDFHNFMGSHEIHDDLTVIILIKKG
jgi:sigma-B regulation protein RsbU (phosphoserine phosphatase)